MPPKPRPIDERFWEKVDKNGPTPEHCPWLGPCWTWQATIRTNATGIRYGRFGVRKGVTWYAHRMAWTLAYGEIPTGLSVLHRCDFGICVRPSHLFLGTAKVNIDDMTSKGRHYLQRNPQRALGSQNSNARLNETQIPAIRSAHADGQPIAAIAREYGVGESTIRHIVRRTHWPHVN